MHIVESDVIDIELNSLKQKIMLIGTSVLYPYDEIITM